MTLAQHLEAIAESWTKEAAHYGDRVGALVLESCAKQLTEALKRHPLELSKPKEP